MRFAYGSLWVGMTSRRWVVRIDPAANTVHRIQTPAVGPDSITAAPSGIYASNRTAGTVTRIDPATNSAVATIRVGAAPVVGAADVKGRVWIPLSGENALVRIDPGSNHVTERLPVGSTPLIMTAGAGSVWVTMAGAGQVWRITP